MSRKILRILGIFLFKNKKVEMSFRESYVLFPFIQTEEMFNLHR